MPDDSRPAEDRPAVNDEAQRPAGIQIPEGFGQPTGPAAAAGGPASEAREAMDVLNEANRVQMEARMPKSYKLSDEQIAAVAARFSKFLIDHNISARAAAKGCDYSEAVLSEWQAGKYKGNRSAIAHAVNDWMERQARRQSAARPQDYIQTQIAEDMRTIAYTADKRGLMAAIVAPAGCGKTYVLKALAEEMRGVYVYCADAMRPLELYRCIAAALGWDTTGSHKSRAELRAYITGKLAGSHRPIFLDEAHQLGQHVGAIRSIHDEAGVAVVMAGTDEILRYVNDRAHGRGQFSSRCIRYNALEMLYDAERPDGGQSGRDLFSVAEVRAFYDMKKIRLADDEALMLLWGLACLPNHGTLRLAEHVAETAADYSRGEPVMRKHVLLAMRLLVGADFKHMERMAGRYTERAGAGSDAVVAAAG